MVNIKFGEKLRRLRLDKGLTMRELERLSGISQAYISQIENDKRNTPSPDILKKLSEPLGIPFTVLLEAAGIEVFNRQPDFTHIIESNLEYRKKIDAIIANANRFDLLDMFKSEDANLLWEGKKLNNIQKSFIQSLNFIILSAMFTKEKPLTSKQLDEIAYMIESYLTDEEIE